ncbi:hypothetical protein CPLU01_15803 [Colletotrichum plurivorum]|uniref:Amine oxidase domain-containing protein n=1 Tax=Colletotrichum plurivorum TaxID=2175906 RepID=A0A8H6MT87_9PEZI|nr:hypothetical protein CPLU01_15803 [Colletotrichum plurivorum]
MGREDQDPVRVAVVGTGLAGLTAAYLVQNDEHKRYAVTLFEQAETLSFDSASVAVRDEKSGTVERIDLPMRALAGGYYSNVMGMYDHLGIPYHPIRFLFSFAKALPTSSRDVPPPLLRSSGRIEGAGGLPGEYFVHASNLHRVPPWPGTRGVFAYLVEIVYLIVCQFWFTLACFWVSPRTDGGESLAEYLRRIWLPRRYATHYLLPLISSVSTCSHDDLLRFPASDVVEYKKLSHRQQHYTVCGGVHQVESRLAREMKDVRLGARVSGVEATDNGKVRIRWQSTRGGEVSEEEEEFDRVILAISPDVAGRLFAPLRKTLGKIPTIRVESSILRPTGSSLAGDFFVVDDADGRPRACAHHQGGVMPSQAICLRTDFGTDAKTEALHTMPGGTVVSTCSLDPAGEAKRVLKTARFTRTLRTTESRAVVQRIMGGGRGDKKTDGDADGWVNGEDNVWLTGAWCWDGMVLLEGCLVSAMRIADDFGVSVPWRHNAAPQRPRSAPKMKQAHSEFWSGLYLGMVAGFLLFAFTALFIAARLLRKNDIYDADHWKLNVKVPFTIMWMNMGYWTDADGNPICYFEQACRNLLHEVLSDAGILRNDPSTSKLSILDLGIGCGDQSWELARLASESSRDGFRYVGLTLNEAQFHMAAQKPYGKLQKASSDVHNSVDVFQADAARPDAWNGQVRAAIKSLAAKEADRWVLGLDSLYHFSPSRTPIMKFAARDLDASFMAFDLLLNDAASIKEKIIVKLVGLAMKCPLGAFVTVAEYRRQLSEAGYDERYIQTRDVTDHVFSGLVRHIDSQGEDLKPYGISLAKYKVAGKMFAWFAKSRALKATIVVARRKPKTS